VTPDIDALRRAGQIAARARDHGAAQIRPGVRVRDVCEAVEAEIHRLGGQPAFPAQSSRNEIAAHYCPSPEDETVYAEGDLAKLDIGVHVDGWVVDTATTVDVGGGEGNAALVEAARAALEAAIAVAAKDVAVARLSDAIARTLRERGLRPMQNLCGHGVGRYLVHCPPPIPNTVAGASGVLRAGMVIAIEPFATRGSGQVKEQKDAEVFRLPPDRGDAAGLDPQLFATIRGFAGLPFARRQLAAWPRERVEETLAVLWRKGWLAVYPPLSEAGGHKVAQAEHSVFIGPDGPVVLTR
jgi:methionyl aminopeptidase